MSSVDVVEILSKISNLELKQRTVYFENSFEWYKSIFRRFEKFGINFAFPEFEPIVIYLEVYLDALNINIEHLLYYQYIFIKEQLAQVKQKTVCGTKRENHEMVCDTWDNIVQNELKTTEESCQKHKLFSIMEDNNCLGEYEIALNGNNYPYAYTLRVILNIVDFLEIWYRHSFSYDNARASEYLRTLHGTDEIINLNDTGYLNLRYRDDYYFYLEYLLENKPGRPFTLLYPTVNKIGATDIQILRSTPINPVGISPIPVFADLSIMSQTNFTWHDINHSRRNVQHNSYHFGVFNDMYENNIMNYFLEMYIFQNKLQKEIKLLRDDTKFEKNMKRMMKVIIFDTVHEDAMPYLPEVVIHNTLKPSNICYPFESPNVVCGNNNKRILRKFHGLGASTLAIMFTKLRYEFYEKENPIEYIVDGEYRTTFHVSIATIELIKLIIKLCPHIELTLDLNGIRKHVINLINDKTNTEKGILIPLKHLGVDDNFEREIKIGTVEYNWILKMNDGVFPVSHYSMTTYDAIVPYKQNYTSYTRFNQVPCFWKSVNSTINISEEFNNEKYIENQRVTGCLIEQIQIKNVKEISPKIDLSRLNKWRNIGAPKQSKDKGESSEDNEVRIFSEEFPGGKRLRIHSKRKRKNKNKISRKLRK